MPKSEPSSFFLSFVGEYVQVITTVQFAGSSSNKRGDAIVPLVLEGYIIDVDSDYTYMSGDGVDIKQAIKNNVIVCVQIVDKEDEDSELLDSLPSNVKKRDMN